MRVQPNDISRVKSAMRQACNDARFRNTLAASLHLAFRPSDQSILFDFELWVEERKTTAIQQQKVSNELSEKFPNSNVLIASGARRDMVRRAAEVR